MLPYLRWYSFSTATVSVCLFVLFQQIIDLQEKAIQRRGVEANSAMALQPVEAPGPVCQQTAKSTKENKNISTTNQAGVASGHA